LVNKKVGVPAVYGASSIGLQALLANNNLSEEQIKLEVIGYTQAASLTEDKVDAAVCYQMNEPVQLETSGYEVNNLEVAKEINFVSNGLLTNEKLIRERPELVQAMAKAFSQGLEEVINDPEQAFLISQKYIPEMKEKETQRAVLKESIRFWQGEKLGRHDSQQWQDSIDFLQKIDLIKEEPGLESLFTNQFLE
jgi:NitT/TauT family transport system substrate-binding protein